MVDGKKGAKARLLAKGYQGPDQEDGPAGLSGYLCFHLSRLQVISLRAPTKWGIWSLDIKIALLQADGSGRDVFHRVWKLRAPAFRLNDAPVAFQGTLRRYLSSSKNALARAGLRFRVSSIGPRFFVILARAVGRLALSSPTLMNPVPRPESAASWSIARGFKGSRKGTCACGHGSFQGERFLDPGGPGGVYGRVAPRARLVGFVGSSSTSVVV